MTLHAYYPLDEDSGTTTYDVIGSNDGTISGAAVNQTGILGTSGYSFDGTDDYVDLGAAVPSVTEFTLVGLMNFSSTANSQNAVRMRANNDCFIGARNGNYAAFIWDGSSNSAEGSAITTGVWKFIAGVWDGSTLSLYVDGEQKASVSVTSMNSGGGKDSLGANIGASQGYYGGLLDCARYYTHAMSPAEIQYLYSTIHSSEFITEVVSFSSNKKPDLFDLVYSLNNQNITMQVFGSPGTSSEEMKEVVLDGSSSYSLSWASGHKDFQVRAILETSDVTVSPTMSSFSIGTYLSGFKFEPGKSNISIDPSLGVTKINPQ